MPDGKRDGYDDRVGRWIDTGHYGGAISVELKWVNGVPRIEFSVNSAIGTEDDYNRVRAELVGAHDECADAAGWEVTADLTAQGIGPAPAARGDRE